jgi:16S rRNA processing protein RimM
LAQVSPARLIPVGKVIRPHGSRGLLRILSYAGDEASFTDAGSLFLKCISSGDIREHTLISIKPHKDFFLVELEGLGTRYDAEEYRGSEILVRVDALKRGADDFFWFELLGLDVYLDTGEYLGKISQIIPTKGHDIYAVNGETGEVLIPATYEVVRKIDLEDKKMIVSAIEGLLDLNEV